VWSEEDTQPPVSKDKRLAEEALRLNISYGRMRGNKREVTIGTSHTVTANSLIESNKQTYILVRYVHSTWDMYTIAVIGLTDQKT
jgi:hypothetical protein